METLNLQEITAGEDWIGLGIAGNQAGHLDQAGEDSDFVHIKAEENAPKGLFPWYIPQTETIFSTNPLSSSQLSLLEETRLQPEPEIGLVVKFTYAPEGDDLVQEVSVQGFGVFNDCSRRVEAPKISLKKNWGEASQGISETIIAIDDFSESGGKLDQYRLVAYLVREGAIYQYGEDTPVSNYCYFNSQLEEWIVSQLNTQTDHGPLEHMSAILGETQPTYGVIGIGATCYTDFGNSEERFLKEGDEVVIVAYLPEEVSLAGIEQQILDGASASNESLVLLRQSVA